MKSVVAYSLVLLSFFLSACERDDAMQLVSMTAILSNPEKFDGKSILVTGYLGRGVDIFLTEEHSKVNDRSSSLLLNLNTEDRKSLKDSACKNTYVEVIGVFGLVKFEGISPPPRIGVNEIVSIKEKTTGADCVK